MTTSNQTGASIPRHARGKRPQFFEDKAVDHAMSMIMVLAEELTVVMDRVDSIERATAQSGLDLAAAIENLELDQDALAFREERRQKLLKRMFYLAQKEAAELATDDDEARYEKVLSEVAEK